MNENQKFEQIWGFRRNIDSSSDDSKSNSDVGPAQEKLGLVPNLVSPEPDRVSETVQLEKKPKRARNTPKKEKKKREVKTKSKKDSCVSSNIKKGGNSNRKKKSKFLSQMTVSDEFKIFTESILDDLKVARETMFEKMRKEMDQIMKSKPSLRSRKKKESGNNQIKNQNQNQNPVSRKRKTTQAKPKKGLEQPQEQVDNEEIKEPISKNPILIDSSAKKPIFSNTQDQIVATSSSYLTLPMVLSNTRSNDTTLKLERGNYSGLQGEERIQNFGHNNNESLCVGNGYPIGLNHHRRFDNLNSFGIPNRVTQGFSHEGNLLGTRMVNGGIRYNAGLAGHTIPNHLASNGLRSLYPN